MDHRSVLRRLQNGARRILICHIGERQRIPRKSVLLRKVYAKLMTAGLLKPYSANDRFSVLTEDGRMVVAIYLANKAEELVRSGCWDPTAEPINLVPMLRALPIGSQAAARQRSKARASTEN